MHVHILGICGTFMGGLALIARSAGHRVTGCDAGVYPPMSTQLEQQGIRLIDGYDASQIKLNADLYIIGNAISRGNPLMEAILNHNLPYVSGPQWLADHVMGKHHVLAVAGTHGKTSTSAMLAWILQCAGMPASFLIGGVAPDLQVSARLQDEPAEGQKLFVIEADEYDTAFFDKRSKFVHYRPRTLVLNNLEFDHADIFPDLAAIETQFHHLVRTVPSNGQIIRPATSQALDRVLAKGCWTPVETIGAEGRWWHQHENADASSFEVLHKQQAAGTVNWALSGRHNQLNALAAIAAAHHVGVPAGQSCQALSQFSGVRRRLELLGSIDGIQVYDDFAHHPSAIDTTIAALRSKLAAGERILAIIEPRSNTMKLGTMAARLPAALKQADQIFCYGSKDGPHALGWDPATVLADLGSRLWTGNDLNDLCSAVCRQARSGDHVLIMSNGSFGGIHQKLLTQLGQGRPQPSTQTL